MAELINLRRERKRRARAEKADQAAANRARHGTSKAEREHSQAVTRLEDARLDGLRREREED